jgi:hypothetical protein
MDLPQPPFFAPWSSGVYDTAPNIKPLGTDYGNGELDGRVLIIDSDVERYLDNNRRSRAERLDKYFATKNFLPEVEAAAVARLVERATVEYPALFCLDGQALRCALTGDTLVFDAGWRLANVEYGQPTDPAYVGAYDAMCSQLPEDHAVMIKRDEGEWVAAAHVCAPALWMPTDKVGLGFAGVHEAIPGGEKIIKGQKPLMKAMIDRGPFVQFIWGIESDNRLNHHREPPPGEDAALGHGRDFGKSEFFVRIEREVVSGLPDVQAGMLTIKVCFVPGSIVLGDQALRESLKSALLSMSPATRAHRGIDCDFDRLIALLG